MAVLDSVFVAVLVASLVLGAWRGLVYEVLSVLSWIAAFIVAQWLAADAAAMLPMTGSSPPVRYAAGFAVVFIAVVFAGALLAWLTKKLVAAVGLRPVDRMLGGLFGLFRGAILVLALAVVVTSTPLRSAGWWSESKGAAVATATLQALKPVLPQPLGRYLPG
ncbi:MAG: CvpA family protein [Ramlibacter sp.]